MVRINRDSHPTRLVWIAAFVFLVTTAGGPWSLFERDANDTSPRISSLPEIEIVGQREVLDFGDVGRATGDHMLFSVTEEPAAAVPVNGNWSIRSTGVDCDAPGMSMWLRQSEDRIYGYGLVSRSACEAEPSTNLTYTIVQGRQQDGTVVLTIVEKIYGQAMYRFQGNLLAEGLAGDLEGPDGALVADGVVFQPASDGHL